MGRRPARDNTRRVLALVLKQTTRYEKWDDAQHAINKESAQILKHIAKFEKLRYPAREGKNFLFFLFSILQMGSLDFGDQGTDDSVPLG